MPRIRSLKYDYFINEELAQISSDARLLGLGLTTLADREGRLADRPLRIKVLLFPYHNVDIDSLLNELQTAHFLKRYTVGKGKYIQVVNFLKHQKPHPKEAPSTIPSREKVSTSREKKTLTDAQGKPSKVGNGSGNGLGDLGALGNRNGSGNDHTHTDRRAGVCVTKSQFSIQENMEYAWAAYRAEFGVKQPDAWAAANFSSGKYDELVAAYFADPASYFPELKPPM